MPVQIFCRKNSLVHIRPVRRYLEELLRYSGSGSAFLELSLVGPKKILQLNRDYRGRAKVTDVLSFPLDPKPVAKRAPWHLGEIVIATEVAKRQAKRARRTLEQQVLRLAVHGYVHLSGLDHEKGTGERRRFEGLEKKYLRYLNRKGWIPWDGSLRL
jgi:probable rRNA maturation factor